MGTNILEETSLMGTKPVKTPMDSSVKLCVDHGELLSNPDSYRRLVGEVELPHYCASINFLYS